MLRVGFNFLIYIDSNRNMFSVVEARIENCEELIGDVQSNVWFLGSEWGGTMSLSPVRSERPRCWWTRALKLCLVHPI